MALDARRKRRRFSRRARPQDSRAQAEKQVLAAAAEHEIDLVRLWFTDVLGFMKAFAIPAEELSRAFSQGVTFDGSAIEGFARRREEDLVARPDPFTFQLLPWGSPKAKTATMFCDVYSPAGEPFEGDSRAILRRQIAELESVGVAAFVGPEVEFFLFRSDESPQVLDRGTYFDVTTADVSSDFRRTVVRYLEQLGIPVEESHHEVAESQHEIDLRFADALTMADSIMTFRLAVKEAATEFGIYATFMPKPIQGAWGSGMHLHLALMDGDRNALAGDDAAGLSPLGGSFVAGILEHARAMSAITNQWVNSYKRLIPGFEAPVFTAWGRANRSALVRVPTARDGQSRIEIRSPDPSCNPYLAFAMILGAGIEGVRSGAQLPPEAVDDPEAMVPAELVQHRIRALPQSLREAVDELESSDLARRVLGDHVLEWIVRNKRAEWQEYTLEVTPFEVRRYFSSL